MVIAKGLETTSEVVDYFLARFLSVEASEDTRAMLVEFLDEELGTSSIADAKTYMEDGLRLLVHLIMSQPEYQLA
jgi:hypothetical protein